MHQHGRHAPSPPSSEFIANEASRRNAQTPPPSDFISSASRMRASPTARRATSPPIVQHSTPPPYDYFTPIDSRMRNSSPLNPWNPYLRSYGRVYPYSMGVNQYENAPRNYVVSMRDTSPQPRSLPTYPPRVHLVPPYREFNPSLSSLPLGDTMRRSLSRRSNRSFHQYRHDDSLGVVDSENHPRYFSNAVIEISSDEDETRPSVAEFLRHPESVRSPFSRSGANKENILMRSRHQNVTMSPSRRPSAETKPIAHIRPSSSEDNISSSVNHFQNDDSLALNLSNRMKRPHRFSPQNSNKHCRFGHGFRRNRSQSQDTASSYSADESEQVRKKPNIKTEADNMAVVNSTSASTSQLSDNDNNNNNNGNSNNSEHNVEQKFKIRIKREFKTESNCTSESNENANQESEAVADTKEHLRPLIADIKQE